VDNLYGQKFILCRKPPKGKAFKAIDSGIDWLADHFAKTLIPPKVGPDGRMSFGIGNVYGSNMYYFYGVERVGLACGYKYFGENDWYKMAAEYILRRQRTNGRWDGGWADGKNVGATAYALLFLVRGRRPVIINKLQHSGDWNNRPRALANLSRDMSRRFEADVNWQIINFAAPVEDWHDAPVVLISGAKPVKFTDKQLDQLRTFVWQGGTLLSVTECNGAGFTKTMRGVYAKLFPRYELTKCAADHEVYSIHCDLHGSPPLEMVSNGIRPLAIHTSYDLLKYWQLNSVRLAAGQRAFETAVNIMMLVSDKGSFRHRGATSWPSRPDETPRGKKVRIARLKFPGNYDPEPLAYERFSRRMAREVGVAVEVAGPMDIADLPGSKADLAVLAGTGTITLAPEEVIALKKFVTGGGTVLFDAAGGSDAFATSARATIRALAGEQPLRRLPADSPLYRRKGKGMEIARVTYRRATATDDHTPRLRGAEVAGRAALLLSGEDLLCGLVGYASHRIDGYAPQSAFELLRNIALNAADARR